MLVQLSSNLNIRKQIGNLLQHIIANLTKDYHNIIFRTQSLGWVGETQMDALPLSEPYRAVLCGIVANGHPQVERFISKFVHWFGAAMMSDSDGVLIRLSFLFLWVSNSFTIAIAKLVKNHLVTSICLTSSANVLASVFRRRQVTQKRGFRWD